MANTMAWHRMGLLACFLFVNAATSAILEKANTDVSHKSPDIALGVLFERIDQLEERLAARDRKHHDTIETLKQQYREEIDALNTKVLTQSERITALESGQQQDQIEKLMKNKKDEESTKEWQAAQNEHINMIEENIAASGANVDARRDNSKTIRIDSEVQESAKSSIKRAENEAKVAFFALLSVHAEHLGPNQNIRFDNVMTNVGNAYHPNIGSFIAPVAGTYVFTASLTTVDRNSAHYGIFLNSAHITTLWINGYENLADSNSQTVVFNLNFNDDVTIRHLDLNHTLHGYSHSMFSGFLLYQDFSNVPIVGK